MSLPLNFSAGDFMFASAPHLFFLKKKRLSYLPLVIHNNFGSIFHQSNFIIIYLYIFFFANYFVAMRDFSLFYLFCLTLVGFHGDDIFISKQLYPSVYLPTYLSTYLSYLSYAI